MRVKLTVELGSCQIPMRDVLQLNPGSVVKLDKAAQTPVDLYANQKLIARGEVVVVDDCLRHQDHRTFGSQRVIQIIQNLKLRSFCKRTICLLSFVFFADANTFAQSLNSTNASFRASRCIAGRWRFRRSRFWRA